jgi:hypothetical protein
VDLGNASATNADAKKIRQALTAAHRPAPNRSSREDDSARQTSAMTISIAGAEPSGRRDT